MKRGVYFKEPKTDNELFAYHDVKAFLAEPISDNKNYLDVYNYTLKTAFKNTRKIDVNSKLHSNFQDSAFNQNLFLWDSCFITRFLTPFNDYLPGIKTLNNFYALQLENGLIPREVNKYTGKDYQNWVNQDNTKLHSVFHLNYKFRGIKIDGNYQNKWYPDLGREVNEIPFYTLDNLNHPLLVYAEYYNYLHTKDINRLKTVHESLYRHYTSFKEHLRHKSGLYVTDWASMDNSPRNKGLLIGVDISSEMVLFARLLIEIYQIIDQNDKYNNRVLMLEKDKKELAEKINKYLWNNEDGFFYDLDANFQQIKIKTIASFFPLIAGICDSNQVKSLVKWLEDEKTFNRIHPIPTVAADEPSFNPNGGYWSGGVWAPTNLIVIDGLEYVKEHELAKKIALKHLEVISKVYQDTKTIWENYPADFLTKGDSDKADFIGWSGVAPVLFFIKYHIGIHADAIKNKLYFNIDDKTVNTGIKRFPFLGKIASLKARKNEKGHLLNIQTEDDFELEVTYKGKTNLYQIKGNKTIQLI